MKAAQLLRLTRRNLARNWKPLIVSAFGVALGVGGLTFFLALGAGLSAVVTEVFPAITREIEVVLPQVAATNLLGGDRKLDDDAIAVLARLSGVERVSPKMTLRFPALTRYNGQFFGKELHMGLEVIGVGIAPEIVAAETKLPFVDPGPDLTKPIPVVVNRRLIEIYNKVFAPQRGLPHLSESMLIGFTFPIDLGRSWIAARTMPNPQETSLQLVGFSDLATLAGVTMPLSAAQRLNHLFGLDESYSSLLISVHSSSDVSTIAEKVKELGYEIDETERSRALQIGAAVRVATLALALLAALISVLSSVNIAQSFFASVRGRKREIGILRAIGATRGDVQRLFLAEAAATGLAGGLAGLIGARMLGALLDSFAHNQLPDFPFKPQSFFLYSAWMFLAGGGVALAASILGAWFPARRAAALDPARALTE